MAYNQSIIQRVFTYRYQGEQIKYKIWFTSNSDTIKLVVFLGTVQIKKLPEWVAEACPPNTAIVQGAPHWYAKEDGSDMPDYMLGYTKSVLDSLKTHYSLKLLGVVAESQAAPAVIRLSTADIYHSYFKDLVLIQPLGLNSDVFNTELDGGIKLFRRRIIQNMYHQAGSLMHDKRLRYNHRLLRRMANFSDTKTREQYASGLRHSALDDLKQLAQFGNNVTIICGANDRLFPAKEIRARLGWQDISTPILEVKGVPHSPLASKQGIKLLRASLSMIGDKR